MRHCLRAGIARALGAPWRRIFGSLCLASRECEMKRFVVTCFGLLLAMSAASPNYGQTVYQFDGDTNDDFLVAANWDDILAGPDAVPGPLDQAVINDNFVVKYDTAVATNVASLVVGADWPVTGVTGTAGTLNMSAGSIQ